MYTVELNYPDIEYKLRVKPDKDDFIIYLWEKEKGVTFNPYLYKYDDKDGELYHKLEDDWLHNKIDEFGLIHSEDFKEFLQEKYKDQAYDCYWNEQEKLAQISQELYGDKDWDEEDIDY